MLFGVFSAIPAQAATILSIFKVTIAEPQIGKPLPTKASLPQSASTYITNVEWKGELDENGNPINYKSKTTVRATAILTQVTDAQPVYPPNPDISQ